MRKILCVGPQWRGSNAGGLFRALARVGNLISVIDENYYINLSDQSVKVKTLDRLFRAWHIKEFNQAILKEFNSFTPDLVLVYKGAFVLPETLNVLKSKKVQMVNFYPDVSFRTHGGLLALTLPSYDHVFTTKTFGILDMKEQLGIVNSSFIPHGFDPDIHRSLNLSGLDNKAFECDVSFIGGWSEKKENMIVALLKRKPDLNVKIWGARWENATNEILKPCIQHKGILGDLYTLGILSSKINLGLLHEKVKGASSGDLITSRTFHIPGAGGFMIHERTPEIGLYFKEDEEVVCFDGIDELVDKVVYYINNNPERTRIAEAGYIRAVRDHSLDARAKLILELLAL